MATTTIHHHVRRDDLFESNAQAYDVDTPAEFHTLDLTIKGKFSVTLFFTNKVDMITALNDLRLTCENKIWELTGMPEEYDLAAEPF